MIIKWWRILSKKKNGGELLIVLIPQLYINGGELYNYCRTGPQVNFASSVIEKMETVQILLSNMTSCPLLILEQ